jgi:DinB superfamily
MASHVVQALREKTDAAYANLSRQLQGMESHLERADAPGEWTTRQVLCHLLFEPRWNPVDTLKTFSHANLPVIEVKPGLTDTSGPRAAMSLRQFLDALDGQRKSVFGYLDSLNEADLQRKARIPLFKQIMGTDEIAIPVFVGALFDYHWNDHAGQLAKIRKAAGLAETK